MRLKFAFFAADSKHEDKGVRQLRFQELRDTDGAVLVQGLHPAIAVVAANAGARAGAVAALEDAGGCKIVRAGDLDEELALASRAAAEEHEARLSEKRDQVAGAERALAEAADAAVKAVHEAARGASDLARFEDLADRLASAEEGYEAAVRAEAEAARSLAASLSELDHVLDQRRSANASLDEARSSRDNRGVPEAVVQQAVNVQAALASAEAAKNQAVEQADEYYQGARAAAREALAALQEAHSSLSQSLVSTGSPDPGWGPGIPLPGLVANHRDQLAARLSAAGSAETSAKGAEAAARSRLESQQQELAALESAGVPELDPLEVALQWANAQEVAREDAVVADDAFRGFGPEGVAALVTTFSERGCQVIYLTEDPSVLSWAIGLPSQAGAATTVGTSRSHRFALTSS